MRTKLALFDDCDRQAETQLPHDFDKTPLWTMEKPEISVNLITIDGEMSTLRRFSGALAAPQLFIIMDSGLFYFTVS
ncbi:hypothetical protein C7293_04720 [filamentous cyanobacterium CCT1]|nr:hypothetical protein C7293_04720 [filamentous cyanobacterium CCT1]PSN81203.1 hypothetical protein C8B47_02625 [filamentous cyanobacterium CCP4]